MAFAAQVRQQIEAALAGKSHARSSPVRLQLAPRFVASGAETGYLDLDQLLHVGLPLAGTTEIIGARSSGRSSIAAAYLAERSREGHVCAWIDVAGDLNPEAALIDGVDLDRVLWITCSGAREEPIQPATSSPAALHLVPLPQIPTSVKPDLRPYNPTRNRQVGTPGASNRPLTHRGVQVATDRLPSRRGALVLQAKPTRQAQRPVTPKSTFVKAKKPWSRLEQSIKAVDYLLQSGGFGAIVLDLGAIAPQFVQRIPLATWFRWRAAAERSRCSLVVLSQLGCTGSSAELTLRVLADLPEPGTVLKNIPYRLEVLRRRFDDTARKPPTRAHATPSVWCSQPPWITSCWTAS